MKTKQDYLQDEDFVHTFMDAYKDNSVWLGTADHYTRGNYFARFNVCKYAKVTYKTINIYYQNSIFLLAHIELELKGKTYNTKGGSPAARMAIEEIIQTQGFKKK